MLHLNTFQWFVKAFLQLDLHRVRIDMILYSIYMQTCKQIQYCTHTRTSDDPIVCFRFCCNRSGRHGYTRIHRCRYWIAAVTYTSLAGMRIDSPCGYSLQLHDAVWDFDPGSRGLLCSSYLSLHNNQSLTRKILEYLNKQISIFVFYLCNEGSTAIIRVVTQLFSVSVVWHEEWNSRNAPPSPSPRPQGHLRFQDKGGREADPGEEQVTWPQN